MFNTIQLCSISRYLDSSLGAMTYDHGISFSSTGKTDGPTDLKSFW